MEKVRIPNLLIENIGPFGRLELNFPEKTIPGKAEIHILTGENGTGKTTILEALASIAPDSIKLNNRARKNTESKTKISFNDHSNIEYKYENGLYELLSDSPILSKYRGFLNNQKEIPADFALLGYSGYRQVFNAQITGISEIELQPFQHAVNFGKSVDPEIILQWIANTIAAKAIAGYQQDFAEARQRENAILQLETTISSIIDKPVKFKLETKPYAVKIEVAGEQLDFSLLPDGLKSIISWISDLLMRMDRVKWVDDIPVFERNFILFLDEIEVHLHPAWQRKILPVVQNLFPNAQIFISTHSPFVIGSVDGAWIHKLVKPNGDSQLAAGYPMLSEDAKSVRYWLDEVFDIREQYGDQVERDYR
ncbi:MAG: AAA family ATPase [Bacteroidota bacterium]